MKFGGGGATRKTAPACDLTISHSGLAAKSVERESKRDFMLLPCDSETMNEHKTFVMLNLFHHPNKILKQVQNDIADKSFVWSTNKQNILCPAIRSDESSRMPRTTFRHSDGSQSLSMQVNSIWHLWHQKSCKAAFTMAEVLITLGIIGIVAAMTMPMLLAKYQKQVTIERLKKFYSVMANVINLSEAENGEMVYWDFPKDEYDKSMDKFFQRYYLPYMKDARECYSANCFSKEEYTINSLSGQDAAGIYLANYIVKTNDGMYIYFLPNTLNGYIWMFVDINAHQKPNQVGRDIFVFDIYGHPNYSDRKNYYLKFWGSNYYKTTEDLITSAPYGCNKSGEKFSGFLCGALIFRSGWKIPDNYPW